MHLAQSLFIFRDVLAHTTDSFGSTTKDKQVELHLLQKSHMQLLPMFDLYTDTHFTLAVQP